MTTTRIVYVCSNGCNVAYHHPLNYCPRCPGRLVQKRLPWDGELHPEGYFTGKDASLAYKDWVNKNGYLLIGEDSL